MSATTAPLRRSRPLPVDDPGPQLRVVAVPRRRHPLLYLLLVVATIAAGVFGSVTLNALATGAAVESRELESHVVEAERHYAQLVADVAALEDPARIRAAALELGLEPAGPGRHLELARNLPADGAVLGGEVAEDTTDPLKPLLSLEP